MNKRQLGNTDLHFTEIGFGAWAIGGPDWSFGWGPQDDKQSIAAIQRAVELGVNWIDTAAIYGLGHSEKLVAEAVKDLRDEVYVATKCSLIWDDKGNIDSCLLRNSVRKECENSLRRLNTERIDLYQIHWPTDDIHIEEGWEEIGKMIDEGKIRYAGVSNFLASHMERANRIHPVRSLQPQYSMLRRNVEGDEFAFCRQNNVGVVAYSPMQSGLLTGKFDINRVADNDWRKRSGEFKEPNLSINLWFVDQLRPIASGYDKSVAQLAVAWVLRDEVVTSAIVGARSPEQIEETVKGADWKISAGDLEQIDQLLIEREERLHSVS